MKGRDLAIVVAVVLLAGFAVADALRSRAERAETTPAVEEGPNRQAEPPAEWPQGLIDGTLVFTDAQDCRVRVIGLAGGRERPVGTVLGDCRLWAAPVTQRIAYGTGSDSFRFIDLIDTDRSLGEFDGPLKSVIWSPDGQRAAWCPAPETGFEVDVGDLNPHVLRDCPVGYSPRGEAAFAVGTRLLAGGRTTVLRAQAPITFARWSQREDGSIAVVIGGRRLERYESGRLSGALDISESSADPVLSPDNCAVAVEFDPGRIRIGDLGCFAGQPTTIFGTAAAWSPDGNWIAVSEAGRVEFHRLVPPGRVLTYPVQAAELYWRGR